MDQTANQRVTVPESLRALYAPVAEELDAGRGRPPPRAFQRQPLRRSVGQARLSAGRQAAAAGLGAAVGQGLRRHSPEHLTLAADGRVDPHGHAGPRRRARRGHDPPASRHGQRPLGQRSQHSPGRLPVRPGDVPGQLAGRHFRLSGDQRVGPATCARANCGRSKAAATTT